MKSSEMQISVYRGEDGTPRFRCPEEWSGTEKFTQICELCCKLSEELATQKQITEAFRLELEARQAQERAQLIIEMDKKCRAKRKAGKVNA